MFRELKSARCTPSVTVLCILKNEIFFLPAFLDHYRKLGVEQFVFLDDRSDDGTREFLIAQPDCAVVGSDLTFAELVDGKKAHYWWRTALPQTYCNGRWSLLVDADELLELPPGFEDINPFVDYLDSRGRTAVGAVMVDFYPEKARELRNHSAPRSKEELLARYPYFDDCDYGGWVDGQNEFRGRQNGVRQRLVREHQIPLYGRRRSSPLPRMKAALRGLFGIQKTKPFCALSKVPLIRWDDGWRYEGPHKANRPPDPGIQLPLLHFKFTSSLLQKVDFAIASEAYDQQSSEYRSYRDLLDVMIKSDASFLCDLSHKYSGKQDFLPNRILRFDVGDRVPASARDMACHNQ
ncbi:MAG: glycosyltransferase family 2 protein [Proteobacteria bacterium]|nr:glycosyltransferase family 2 protein [Pseudomonadota bacterium]